VEEGNLTRFYEAGFNSEEIRTIVLVIRLLEIGSGFSISGKFCWSMLHLCCRLFGPELCSDIALKLL
jgi:hypothetical protein